MSGSAITDIRETYGAAFIGLLVSTIFYGLTVAQLWIYYRQYRTRDPTLLKGFIAFLFILDTLHTILCTYSLYWYLILNFGNVANLDVTMWSMNIQVEINGLIQILVQLFYARRIYILTKSAAVPAIIAMLATICFALESVFTAKSFALERYSRYGSLIWETCVGMGSSIVSDILIALAMCWHLYRNKTGFSKTDSIIMTLMTYSINTGLVTSILSIGKLVSAITKPTKLIWVAFFWLMGKCYVNTLLAMLNSRDTLRTRVSNNNSSNAFHMSPSFRQNETPRKSKTGQTTITFAVHQRVTADDVGSTDDPDSELGVDKSEETMIATLHDQSPESIV